MNVACVHVEKIDVVYLYQLDLCRHYCSTRDTETPRAVS